jgi:hypothetical protein
MRAFVFAILFGLSCTQAHAQRTGAIRGAGNFGCGEYLEDRKKGATQDPITITWVWGYLSAYNHFSTHKSVDLPDGPTVLAYMDKHCRDNPLSAISGGTLALLGELGGWQSPAFKKP